MIKLMNKLISKIRNSRNAWMMRGGYDPIRYWRIRGRRYRAVHNNMTEAERLRFDAQEAAWREQLQKMSIESALELGCGYGRMLQILDESGISNISGLDISPHQVQAAKRLVPRADLQIHDVQTSLPFDDDSFDLVYTSEVLMHIPDAAPIIKEMIRVAKKYVAHVENPGSADNAPWEFSHDYESTYKSIELDPTTTKIDKQRIITVKLSS
jgi:ubiquinone/menaquinone biosynthesis C-methylase UbiE